jgi:hypothetical protein
MKKQSYSNHKKYDLLFHGVLFLLVFLVFTGSVSNLIDNLDEAEKVVPSVLMVGVSVILILLTYFIRINAVRLQDRIIRAEENQRHFQLTGMPLDSRLHMNQIIALRFSPDSEFTELCKDAVEKHMSSEEIKKAVSRWKGDYHRI